jgi:hypothetical protein
MFKYFFIKNSKIFFKTNFVLKQSNEVFEYFVFVENNLVEFKNKTLKNKNSI